jgi:cell division GTPase FtsZ
MRIIAIGIGGAGCRIVNSLYAIDRKSSKVACVQGLAVDVDEETIKQLTALPDTARMCFSALDAGIPDSTDSGQRTASIDINEIVSRVQNLEFGENDAIIFCCGLGGSMVDVAPHIIAGLRSSVVEPIFGLVTLPCLAEGERISAKAADDIEMLSSLLDGIIVFDNETWHKKIKAQMAHLPPKEKGFAERIGLKKNEKILPPAQATYRNLNEAIVRRIGLILRAGEFRADGGVDLAEVVLDSGEVLNTMKGMGFITIGYAVEKLPHDPLRFLSWLKPAGVFDEEQKRKASRIVELAKNAIYHEISTPCDLTSAHKALVLIAGPTHELSMKGYMTVRKWIDRSIAGLETRSGDYPIVSTKNVAIIVMLSGLENIPRITELKEIRTQSKPKKRADADVPSGELPKRDKKTIRDDMITLPTRRSYDHDGGKRPSSPEVPAHGRTFVPAEAAGMPTPAPSAVHPQSLPPRPTPGPASRGEIQRVPEVPAPPRRHIIIAREEKDHHTYPSSPSPAAHGNQRTGHKAGADRSPLETPARYAEGDGPGAKETERQRIERELRRQRTVAMGGKSQKAVPHIEKSRPAAQETRIIKRSSHQETSAEIQAVARGTKPAEATGEKRTIITGKRKIIAIRREEGDPSPAQQNPGGTQPAESSSLSDDDSMNVDQVVRARDEVFKGTAIRGPSLPQARDSTLLHTELKRKKRAPERDEADDGDVRSEKTGKGMASINNGHEQKSTT